MPRSVPAGQGRRRTDRDDADPDEPELEDEPPPPPELEDEPPPPPELDELEPPPPELDDELELLLDEEDGLADELDEAELDEAEELEAEELELEAPDELELGGAEELDGTPVAVGDSVPQPPSIPTPASATPPERIRRNWRRSSRSHESPGFPGFLSLMVTPSLEKRRLSRPRAWPPRQ